MLQGREINLLFLSPAPGIEPGYAGVRLQCFTHRPHITIISSRKYYEMKTLTPLEPLEYEVLMADGKAMNVLGKVQMQGSHKNVKTKFPDFSPTSNEISLTILSTTDCHRLSSYIVCKYIRRISVSEITNSI